MNQPYYAPPPAPRKRKVWPWIVGGIVVMFLAMMGGCVALVGGAANEIDKESKREVTVTYQVTGSGTGTSVTCSGRDFNIAQDTDVALPWSKEVTIDGLGKTVTLSATNDQDGGAVTCSIKVGDRVISEQQSTGPFATASCTGDAG